MDVYPLTRTQINQLFRDFVLEHHPDALLNMRNPLLDKDYDVIQAMGDDFDDIEEYFMTILDQHCLVYR